MKSFLSYLRRLDHHSESRSNIQRIILKSLLNPGFGSLAVLAIGMSLTATNASAAASSQLELNPRSTEYGFEGNRLLLGRNRSSDPSLPETFRKAIAYEIPTTTSGSWSGTGTTAPATKTTPGGLKMTATVSGAGMTIGNRTNAAMQTTKTITVPALPSNTNGVQITVTAQPSCVATATTCNTFGTFSFAFTDAAGLPVKVKNPVIHMSRLGGSLTATAGSVTKTAVHASTLTLTTPGATLGGPAAGSRGFLVSGNAIKGDLPTFAATAATGTSLGDCTAAPGAVQAGCGSIPVTGIVSDLTFNVSMERRSVTGNGLPKWIEGSSTAADGIYFTVSFDEDFGDAPKTYDAGSAASHIVSDLMLGSSITAENTTVANGGATGTTGLVATSPNAVAAGANNNGLNGDGASDDGVTSFPPLLTNAATYSLPVNISGASRAGQVCGWIDTDKSGTFGNAAVEKACTNFAVGATSVNLIWSGLPTKTVGNTYVRIRAVYDQSTATQTPTGRLNSGEVEDYQIPIVGIPDLTITKTASATTFPRGQKGATFALNVSNLATATGSTIGMVTVTDTLPAGTAAGFFNSPPLVPPAFTPTAAGGNGWTCTIGTAPNAYTPAPISCTRSDALAPGASYPPIIVTVDVSATTTVPTPRVNNATVAGGGQTNTTNDAGSVSVALGANPGTPDLLISKTHSGNFTPGQTGTYTITATNLGPNATTTATVTVVDTLPTGLTYNATTSGTGWTCTPNTPAAGQVSCTRPGSAIAAGASYPAISLVVDVATNAPQSVTNSATVSGGGQPTGPNPNDTVTDLTTISASDLTITKTHTGNFSQQQKGATYTLVANNTGNLATTGTVTVTDTLPAGLTATAIAGSAWNCTLGTLTCTRSDALAPGDSYPPITVTVDVAANAGASLVNNATVSGGGEKNTLNSSAADPTTVTVVSAAPVTISGTVWDDANNSANGGFTNIFTAPETGTTGDGLYAILVNAAGDTIASSVVAADGTYSFTNVLANQSNVTIRLATTPASIGSPAPTAEIFSDWLNTSPVETAVFNIGTANITAKDFGIEQLPNTFDVFATAASINPSGTNQMVVPDLVGYDPEDGNLGMGKSFKILTLPSGGTLYYNTTAVAPGQTISNYDPALLKVDPIDGNTTIEFLFAAIDSAGKESGNPGTVSMTFTANKANLLLVKRITAIKDGVTGLPLKDAAGTTISFAGFVDDTTSPTNTDDNNCNWPTATGATGACTNTYTVGATTATAPKVKPGDEIEYTIYYLNAGGNRAIAKVCDRLNPNLTFQQNFDATNVNKGIGFKPGNATISYLTNLGTDADKGQLTNATVSNCNLPANGGTEVVAVDVGDATTPLLGSTGAGTTGSYGYIRFKAVVK